MRVLALSWSGPYQETVCQETNHDLCLGTVCQGTNHDLCLETICQRTNSDFFLVTSHGFSVVTSHHCRQAKSHRFSLVTSHHHSNP